MLAVGYAEFHRGFLAEHEAAGLVVDLRYNRGGDVSGLLLQKLARRRLGYRVTRWDGRRHYLDEAPTGAMVALTNEQAGSDGDLFSYGFKRLGLGPLIGTRTWGGVVGTWGRQRLVDGTLTTQPELAHWFDDVGWGIENHGVDPDIEVEELPQDDALGVDRQLDRAIETVLGLLERHGVREPGPGPRLAAPALPPRAR
jgi:tricorn protease